METYKTFKGLIYLVIIAGVLVFLSIQFSGGKKTESKYPDSLWVKEIEIRAEERADRKILEFKMAQLEQEIKDLRGKETIIQGNNVSYKKEYAKKSPSQTDRELVEWSKR